MIATFNEIQDEVLRSLSIKPGDETTEQLDSIKMRINEVQDIIFFHKSWEWRKRHFYITTIAPYETGTISVSRNSRTVTGSGTTWADYMKMGYILINSKIYKIDRIASSTSIILKSNFDQSDVSAGTYSIVFPHYAMHSMFTTITAVIREGKELILSQRNHIDISQTDGEPTEVYIGELNDETFYSTGTLDATQASASITGTGTTWTSNMDGMLLEVVGVSERYTIRERTSNTAITLDRVYSNANASTASYRINPPGTPFITFVPYPDNSYAYKVEGLLRPIKLISDNDISLIPDHNALIAGAIWLANRDFQEQSPMQIEQARAEFVRQMKSLEDHYKAITTPKWTDEATIYNRLTGRSVNFNPLDPRSYR